jgi:hypothetical protein
MAKGIEELEPEFYQNGKRRAWITLRGIMRRQYYSYLVLQQNSRFENMGYCTGQYGRLSALERRELGSGKHNPRRVKVESWKGLGKGTSIINIRKICQADAMVAYG